MKSIKTVFENAIQKNRERGYRVLYVAIDVHGTIFRPSRMTEMWMCDNAREPSEQALYIGVRSEYEFYKNALECLRMLSDRNDAKIILWTSTLDTYHLLRVLEENGIKVDYVNNNPDFKCNEYADFSRKFCFDVLLDDKAGFDPETDWAEIMKVDFGKLKGDACGAEDEFARIL